MEDRQGLQDIVERARLGDARAWESLYRRAYPRLLAYARRRLASDDAARDAVSETMTRAVRGLPRFRGEGAGFDAWLSGILRHVVLDAQRYLRRHPPTSSDVPDFAATGSQPDAMAEAASDAAAVRAAFALLPEQDRELLELRVVLGLSSDEAAAVLRKRPGAVRMAQARALQRLRALLEREEAVRHG